ncbi:Phage-related protein [Actinobacillus pleuropneumoniae]|nr:Phage-related protein [Actinobacillus pleuropneumoniae]
MITILDTSLRPVAILEDYYADEISEQINGSYTFKFSVLMDDDKSRYIAINNIVEAEGQYFNIVHHRRSRSDNGEILIAVNCEQVSYNLLYHVFEGGFIHTNTPWVLMNMALEGTGFMVGFVQYDQYVSIDLKEGVNARGVLMEIAAQTGCELYFDKYTVSLMSRRGQDRGVQFRLGKNLKGIVKDVNRQSGEVLTAYEIDVVELNTLPEFEGLEYFELGDTVDIIDEELGINEQQRIIEYSYSPKRRINSKVTIANYIEGIQDTIYRIQTTTVNKGQILLRYKNWT